MGSVFFAILFLIGNVETEFSLSTGDNNQNKNIEVSIERTIENGEDLTNVVIKGEGDVTRKELEEELDRMFEKQGIDKAKTKLNIEMVIQVVNLSSNPHSWSFLFGA